MTTVLNKTNLIVNYLPQNLTDEEFHELFSKPGRLTASKIIRDRATGYSYGFGFVDYATEEDAEKAITMLNGYHLQHKQIKVAYSRQGDNVKGANLYLRNLPKTIAISDIEQMFSPYGEIVQVRVLCNEQGVSKGVGFVLFSCKEQAEMAMQALDGQTPPGFTLPLNIRFAEDNKNKMQATIENAINQGMGGHTAGPVVTGNLSGGNISVFGGGYNTSFNGGGGPMRSQQVRFNRFNPISGGFQTNQQVPTFNSHPVASHVEPGFALFVYNIGLETDEYALWQLFSQYGAVKKVNVMRDFQKKQSKGFGFVTMLNYNEAVTAIQHLNGFNFAGKPLQVSFKKSDNYQ